MTTHGPEVSCSETSHCFKFLQADAAIVLGFTPRPFVSTFFPVHYYLIIKLKTKLNSVALSPQANYTDRATAACRRS
jgi:hypothetical protein